jgi:hypothetical protein
MEKITAGKHTFEIVESVPVGYEIWNIGADTVKGYLPLCQGNYKGNENWVNPYTLKAIKCEDAEIIMAAAGYGIKTAKKAEKYIAKNENKANKQYSVEKAKKALPVLKTVAGLE